MTALAGKHMHGEVLQRPRQQDINFIAKNGKSADIYETVRVSWNTSMECHRHRACAVANNI